MSIIGDHRDCRSGSFSNVSIPTVEKYSHPSPSRDVPIGLRNNLQHFGAAAGGDVQLSAQSFVVDGIDRIAPK